MKRFVQLYAELDASTSTQAKVQALAAYLRDEPDEDACWASYVLSGGKQRQVVPTALMRALCCRIAGIDDWLFEECYQAVGDLAETMAHVLPRTWDLVDAPAPGAATGSSVNEDLPAEEDGLGRWMTQGLLPLKGLPESEQQRRLALMWRGLDAQGRFLLTKLVGGGFRVGVSKLLVQRAMAQAWGLPETLLAQRMMGYTSGTQLPTAERHAALRQAPGATATDHTQPYPFFLAHPLEEAHADAVDGVQATARLGPVEDWIVEWKYDGIRAQLVRRGGQVTLWSRGEELITERFPEVVQAAQALPDGTVLDGELLVMQGQRPAPFAQLQPRINRKTLSRKLLAQSPVSFMAYDLLEWQGRDQREEPQHRRTAQLARVLDAHLPDWHRSVPVQADSWDALLELRRSSREGGVEGFMLKHRLARYGVGRRRPDDRTTGAWWKWKVEPMTVDAVLVYAQRGHGRRASLYTDYTFAVWNRAPLGEAEVQQVLQAIERREPPQPGALQLVPFAKAYSGLSDEEFRLVDRRIRAATVEKFGPVRSVVPSLVFELAFEGINASPRHRSGVAVRFPRMVRLRDDKPLREADTLAVLQLLLGGKA